jgi:hypothetical protein
MDAYGDGEGSVVELSCALQRRDPGGRFCWMYILEVLLREYCILFTLRSVAFCLFSLFLPVDSILYRKLSSRKRCDHGLG